MRLLALIAGIGFLLAAGLGYMDYASLGFPDGHLTAFERETSSLRFGMLIANVILGLLGVACGLGWLRRSRALVLALLVAFVVVAIPSTMLPRCPEMSSCVSAYEAVTGHIPDHGIGG